MDAVLKEGEGKSKEEIKVGAVRKLNNVLCTIWLQCPLKLATKLVNKDKIKVGWTMAKIEMLKARPVQCYRYWASGHLKSECKLNIDRVGACFRCGERGHPARQCVNIAHCVVCQENEIDNNHSLV